MREKAIFSRFTDRARKVMQLANQEAQRLNHEYIGTEHILLGLVKEGSGVAANVLKNLDIDLRKIRVEIEKMVQSGPDMVTMGTLPRTPRAKKVLQYSSEEADNFNHNYVGTEHLLLGLLREQEGVAARVLMALGLKLEDVRGEVVKVLGVTPRSLPVLPSRPTTAELAGGRAGSWIRRHQRTCILAGGLAASLAGAWLGYSLPFGNTAANISAIVAGIVFMVAVALGYSASYARPTKPPEES